MTLPATAAGASSPKIEVPESHSPDGHNATPHKAFAKAMEWLREGSPLR